MSLVIEPHNGVSVRIGEMIWPKSSDAHCVRQQERHLKDLVDAASSGLTLDCSGVEVGNSEAIEMLRRVQNYAGKQGKRVVLFNIPDTFGHLIRLCNLQATLPSVGDAETAQRLVASTVAIPNMSKKPVIAAAASMCVFIAFVCWMLLI